MWTKHNSNNVLVKPKPVSHCRSTVILPARKNRKLNLQKPRKLLTKNSRKWVGLVIIYSLKWLKKKKTEGKNDSHNRDSSIFYSLVFYFQEPVRHLTDIVSSFINAMKVFSNPLTKKIYDPIVSEWEVWWIENISSLPLTLCSKRRIPKSYTTFVRRQIFIRNKIKNR